MKKILLYSLVFFAGILPFADASSTSYKNSGVMHSLGGLDINVKTLSNTGTMSGSCTHINCTEYEGSGSIIGTKECSIRAKTIQSSGKIEGGKVSIICDKFSCNGTEVSCCGIGTQECFIKAKKFEIYGVFECKKVTIICDEFKCNDCILADECRIYVKNVFEYAEIRRNPYGKYTIIITPYGFEPHTYNSLHTAATSTFVDNYMTILDEDIAHEVKKIRSHARLNNFDDTNMLETVKNIVKEKLNGMKEELNNNSEAAASDEKKYHKLSLILAEIEHSLITQDIPEEIIEL